MSAPNVYVAHSGAVATASATLKSIIGIQATATMDFTLEAIQVSMDVITAALPALVEVVRTTTLGTFATTPAEGKYNHANDRAAICNAVGGGASVEPTRADVLEQFLLTPASPTFFYEWPYGIYPDCNASATASIVISVTPGTGTTPNVRASMRWCE